MKKLRKALKAARKELAKQATKLPNEDAYATVYSILIDGVRAIDDTLKSLEPAVKEAKKERKRNPNQSPNRAVQWCGKP